MNIHCKGITVVTQVTYKVHGSLVLNQSNQIMGKQWKIRI